MAHSELIENQPGVWIKHLDEAGCHCDCSECTVYTERDTEGETIACICPDCDPALCGLHR